MTIAVERKRRTKNTSVLTLPTIRTKPKTNTPSLGDHNYSAIDYMAYRAQQDAVAWCRYYRNLRGGRMGFHSSDAHFHRPFLEQPLRDQHPIKAFEKSRQAGGSEVSLSEVLWFLCTHPDTKWVYVFPRLKQWEDFAKTRIFEAIDQSKHLIEKTGGSKNLSVYLMKFLPSSFMFGRSGWEPDLGEGIDADGVTFDEVDRMNPNIKLAFRESLTSSKFGWRREVSTPTIPEQGVDALFHISDQQLWYLKCESCGLEQFLDFPDNILPLKEVKEHWDIIPPGSYRYCCKKCKGKINRWVGRWIPTYPDKAGADGSGVRGYRINQLSCPWIPADEIMQKKKEFRVPQLFFNYVIGRPYAGSGIMIQDQDFIVDTTRHEMNIREHGMELVSVGIDWGNINWFVILGKRPADNRLYVLKLGWFVDTNVSLGATKAVAEKIGPFRPDIIVGDAGYGQDRNTYIQKIFPRKTFACYYPGGKSGNRGRIYNPKWNEKEWTVKVDKTTSLKTTCQDIVDGRVQFYAGTEGFELIKKHVTNLTTINEMEDEEIIETIRTNGPDHLADALNYARIGMERMTESGGSFYFGMHDLNGTETFPGLVDWL